MSLSQQFHELLDMIEDNPSVAEKAAELVLSAPPTPESDGLLALIYHEGIGVEQDFEKAFEYAERAAAENEGSALFLLGYMCDNAETPDQAEGGPLQKYDHYDAERFMERCAATDSRWAVPAHLWLGDYFMDMAQGGDPEIAVEHYEAIAEQNGEAACRLSDYYWEQMSDDCFSDNESDTGELEENVFRWTVKAVQYDPAEYSFRMACCYADGIGCDAEKGFRLARKYWEDAYSFGSWRAAEAIADLYRFRLDSLPAGANENERLRCEAEIASWRKLARIARERNGKKDEEEY